MNPEGFPQSSSPEEKKDRDQESLEKSGDKKEGYRINDSTGEQSLESIKESNPELAERLKELEKKREESKKAENEEG